MTSNIQNFINQYKCYILLLIIMILFIINNRENNKIKNKPKNKVKKGGRRNKKQSVSNSINLDIDTSMYDTPSDFIDDKIGNIKNTINKKIKIKDNKNKILKKINNIRNNINLSTIPENLETESEIIQEPISAINPNDNLSQNQISFDPASFDPSKDIFPMNSIVQLRTNIIESTGQKSEDKLYSVKGFNSEINILPPI